MRYRDSCKLGALLYAVASFAACGDDDAGWGMEGGACLPDNTCDEGLVCLSDYCVSLPDGGPADASPPDAEPADAVPDALPDASLPDARILDAAYPDAAWPDAVWADADLGPDAGPCDLDCPQPVLTSNTVCGVLLDVATNAPITAGGGDGTDCASVPSDEKAGPCLLKVSFFDALAFANNPSSAPLPTEETVINTCGHFRAVNIPTPAMGFMAVVVDDADSADSDDQALSARYLPVLPGDRVQGLRAYAVSKTTDAGWTSTAGDPFGGATFAEGGAVLAIFLRAGVPVHGVQITRYDEGVVEADDYYFADDDPWKRSIVDNWQDATGANGTGLMVNSSLTDHGGTGGLPGNCEWPEEMSASIGDVVSVHELHAILGTTGEPCPP